jgi:probable HAF family extracellular repeat protein
VEGQTGFDFSAFLWRNGEMINLGYLGEGDFSEAYGINDLNQIVGRSTIDRDEFITRAFLWQDGEMFELPRTPDNPDTEAIAINNAGKICGQAWSNQHTTWRPVVWDNGQIIELGTFRPDNEGVGICIDVNEGGDVVGYAAWDFFYYRAFVYYGNRKRALPSKPNWTSSYAWSINDRRQVVGAARVEQSELQNIGCIWELGQPPQYLHDLIPPSSNWFIGLAIHNNNAGQITGTGFRLDDREHTKGFLLTPVNATMELADPTPGIAGGENTLTVTGAEPGATVHFLYSRHGGGIAIPGCDLQQNALQLDRPTIIGSAVADANGVASITRNVPSIARGRYILFQAVVQGECEISQLVVHEFQ